MSRLLTSALQIVPGMSQTARLRSELLAAQKVELREAGARFLEAHSQRQEHHHANLERVQDELRTDSLAHPVEHLPFDPYQRQNRILRSPRRDGMESGKVGQIPHPQHAADLKYGRNSGWSGHLRFNRVRLDFGTVGF